MDNETAKKILGLNEDFTQIDLLQSYKASVEELCVDLVATIDENEMSKVANDLYDNSTAYLALRAVDVAPELRQQPLIVFTDASVRKDNEYASFGIVVENIFQDFNIPEHILEKYNIQIEPESCHERCVLSGIIANFSINVTEMMGIFSALDIFQFLARETGQSIVFYTDSLVAKKVLPGKRLPAGSQQYSEIKKMFKKIIDVNALDIKIKKVAAHSGIEMNEMADSIAKKRLIHTL